MPSPAFPELHSPYSVTPAQVAQFRRDGFIKLKQVLSPALLAYYGREITNQVGETVASYDVLTMVSVHAVPDQAEGAA